MRILIITQVIDKNHPILGFFHRWVEEFAKNCEEVHVVCLYEGEHTLPSNVTIHSLGKNKKEVSSFRYSLRLLKFSWQLRKKYDTVFVHMNPEYVIVGGLLWRLLGKKIRFWYAHGTVSTSLKIAEKMSDKIFTASSESFRLSSKKTIVTGHGIDTVHFAPQNVPKDFDLITVGRISKSKNIHTLIDIFSQLKSKQKLSLTIIGEAMSEEDKMYKKTLDRKIEELDLAHSVSFIGSVSQAELPNYLSRAKVFVHTAQNGSLDKSILESLAVGIPVITMAEGAASLPLGDCLVSNVGDFIIKVQEVLQSDIQKQTRVLCKHIHSYHSLSTLIPKILELY